MTTAESSTGKTHAVLIKRMEIPDDVLQSIVETGVVQPTTAWVHVPLCRARSRNVSDRPWKIDCKRCLKELSQ